MPNRYVVSYVAATHADAVEGAAALERAESSLDVRPTTGDEIAAGRGDADPRSGDDVDCVVFAETPTTAEGAALLDVIDAAAGTPLVLFCDASFAPTAARSTDGVAGYVRRDTAGAFAHLADEVRWVCQGERAGEPNGGDDRTAALARSLAACEERDAACRRVVAAVAAELDVDRCWVRERPGEDKEVVASAGGGAEDQDTSGDEDTSRDDGVSGDDGGSNDDGVSGDESTSGDGGAASDDGAPSEDRRRSDDVFARSTGTASEAIATGEIIVEPIEGVDGERVAVAAAIPLVDDAALRATTTADGGFGDRTLERLAALGELLSATLARLERERSLERSYERAVDEYDRLHEERDRLAAQRDRLRSLFAAVPEPALCYAFVDGRAVVAAVNEALASTFAVDEETIRGEPLADVVGRPDVADGGDLADALRRDAGSQVVGRRETVDGVRDFLISVAPLGEPESDGPGGADSDEDAPVGGDVGRVAGLCVYSDVTEARRTERELAAARERLEELGRMVEDEARPALNVARGYLELAEETGDGEHFREVEDGHDGLREALDHLAGLAGRDAAIVETEYVGLHDVARRAWVAVDPDDARLRFGRDAVVTADAARLRECFEHLVRTAAGEGGDEGDGAPDGDAATGDGDATTVVSVGATDDGFYVAGFAEGAGGDPFAGRTAAADGTGLRLGLVERVAETHGWRVGVAKNESGTAFAFRGVDVEPAE